MRKKIAVLVTCYNRKDTTLKCLNALGGQEGIDNTYFHVYFVDDGCTDGTGDAVHARFPDVKILQGDGNLYWGGGMRLAWDEAFKGDYDYYLWLNDDTLLYTATLRTMLDTAEYLREETGDEVIVSGSTRDPHSGVLTYGGVSRPNRWQRMQFNLVVPSDRPKKCETINGNCVLIPRNVAQRVGNLSPDFSHGLGDYDYGLRAARYFSVTSWITPGFIGTCSAHDLRGSHIDSSASIPARLKAMKQPGGLPDAKEWMIFTRRHVGWLWPFYRLRTLIRIYFPWLWLLLRGKSVSENIIREKK